MVGVVGVIVIGYCYVLNWLYLIFVMLVELVFFEFEFFLLGFGVW